MAGLKCRACGSGIGSDEQFCAYCGAPRADSEVVPPPLTSTGRPARRWGYAALGLVAALAAVVIVLMLRESPQSIDPASREVSVAGRSPSASPTLTSPSPKRTSIRSAPAATGRASASRPAAPKRTATPRPPDLSAADLDPCSGGAYPFEYALGASSSPSPAGSDERQAVANVQTILADLGYQGRSRTVPIAVDGWFGSHTEYAVRNFQRDQGIDPVGTVYRLTWEALGEYC